MSELMAELTALLNRHSVDSRTDTPDFLLAQYLVGCLQAYEDVRRATAGWWGYGPGYSGEGDTEARKRKGG